MLTKKKEKIEVRNLFNGIFSDRLGEPSLVLILKWGGELTPAGRIQAEELGRIFRCMYPGGQGRHLSGSYLMFICLPCPLLIFYANYRR